MKKIIQLGAYGSNLGDAIALLNIRENLDKDIQWTSLHIRHKFDIDYINTHDVFVIGGGGLIQAGSVTKQRSTNWNFDFSASQLSKIKIPIFVFAVGLNFWRNRQNLSISGIEQLKMLIEFAEYFSVRNDGSFQKIMEICPSDKIYETADPGLISKEVNQIKNELKTGVLSIALGSGNIMNSRNISIVEIKQVIKECGLTVFPHCKKDIEFRTYGEYIDIGKDYMDINQFDKYNPFDYAITMRGHGQLICHAKNIPFISINTQDKMSGFMEHANLSQYSVDTQEKKWFSQLRELIDRLRSDSTFLHDWYMTRSKNHDKYVKMFKSTISKLLEIL